MSKSLAPYTEGSPVAAPVQPLFELSTTPHPLEVLALRSAITVAVVIDVLVMLSRLVEAFALVEMDRVPGSPQWFWLALMLLILGQTVAVLRGNRAAARPHDLEGAEAILLAPAVALTGLILWALLAWLTPVPGTVLVYALSAILGGAAAVALLYVGGPGPAARTAAEGAAEAERAEWATRRVEVDAIYTKSGLTPREDSTTRSGRRTQPATGEIWWATVPFEDQPGSKDRPILVLAADDKHVWGLYSTSTDHSGDPKYLPAPPGMWQSEKESYLRLDRPIQIARQNVRRFESDAPRQLREQVDEWFDRHPKAPARPRALPPPP